MSQIKFFDFSSKSSKQKIILAALWILIALGLYSVRSVLLPFALASLLAYVFHPVVGFLCGIKVRNKSLPRFVSVLLIYFILLLSIGLLCTFFVPQFYKEMLRLAKEASAFFNSLDENSIIDFSKKIEGFFHRYQLPIEIVYPKDDFSSSNPIQPKSHWISIDILSIYKNTISYLFSYLSSESKTIVISAQHVAAKLISFMFKTVLLLMITAFMLVDYDRIKNFVYSMVPLKDRGRFAGFLHRLDQGLSGVVRGQLTICIINGLLTLIGLLIFKVKFAFILATLAGIFSIVPIFGSIASTIPIVLVALTQSPLSGLLSLLWIIGIHTLEANLLNPKIMGHSAKIHPVLIILALVAGEQYHGIIGALLAVPIMSVLITIFSSILGRAHQMDEGLAKPAHNDRITD